MIFRDDAAAIPTGRHAEAHVEQLGNRRPGMPGATAGPQHRPARFGDHSHQIIDGLGTGDNRRRAGQLKGIEPGRPFYDRPLDVDGNLDTDRSAWRADSVGRRTLQHGECLLRRADAVVGLADSAQHVRLAGNIVNRAEIAIDELGRGLAGEMQNRATGEVCLDQGRDGVGRPRAGAGDQDAKVARGTGKPIGHMAGAHFAAGHDKAQ